MENAEKERHLRCWQKIARKRGVNDFAAGSGATPMGARRLKKILSERVAKRAEGVIYEGTRADVVERMVAAGFVPTIERSAGSKANMTRKG